MLSRDMLTKFILFGCLGILGEVANTAFKRAISERNFEFVGEASLLIFPFYGLIAFIFPAIAHQLGDYTWWQRGGVYMFAFYLAQFFIGLGLSRLNMCPWHYDRFALNGLVSISSAPIWFTAGLLVEWVYPWVKALSELA